MPSFLWQRLLSLSFFAEKRDRLNPVLNEEVRSLRTLEPTSSEYLFKENMNESLKLAKENYKLLLSIKSINKGQDLHQGQVLNKDQIMELETVFLLETSSLFTTKTEKWHIHREHPSFRGISNPGDISSLCWKYTAQKMKFSIKDFFRKCDQIRRNP